MKLHEHQAKKIFAAHGIPIPLGKVATTPSEAAAAAFDLGTPVIVKAQIHAGGRGKAGGVKIAKTPGSTETTTRSMLDKGLITEQTGSDKVIVESVLVEESLQISEELYLAMAIDGSLKRIVAISSKSGGMDIEKVAHDTPEKIFVEPIDPGIGIQSYQCRNIAYKLNIPDNLVRPFVQLTQNLYSAFISTDASLAEINPLVITSNNTLVAADAKLDLDDDALFRHSELSGLKDANQEDPLELLANSFNINYVRLDGNVGCIVNGAGLAMATMDVASAAGAHPANFLDIGGGADEVKVSKALQLVLSDERVQVVLVNLFGGILRCDVASKGFLLAANETQTTMRPMVVRMLGTNADEGRRLLSNSDLDLVLVDTLEQAATAIKTFL